MRMAKVWFVVVAAAGIAACSGGKGGVDDESTIAVAEGTIVPEGEGAAVDTVNPYEGVWDLAMVRGHLARAGVETIEAGEVRQPFMGARGTRLRGDGGEIQVFIYADAGARARDTDRLDSTAIVLPGDRPDTPQRAALVTANNLAAIVVGEDSTLLESVSRVLRSRGN